MIWFSPTIWSLHKKAHPCAHSSHLWAYKKMPSNLNEYLFSVFSFFFLFYCFVFTPFRPSSRLKPTSLLMTALSGGFRILISIRLHGATTAASCELNLFRLTNVQWQKKRRKIRRMFPLRKFVISRAHPARRINSMPTAPCNICYGVRTAQLIRAGVYVAYT